MGKMFDKLMNTMHLNGDDYDETYEENTDYDDASYDDTGYDNDNYDSYDNYDTYDDEYEEAVPERKTSAKKTSAKKASAKKINNQGAANNMNDRTSERTTKSGNSKIVPIKNSQSVQELRVVRPSKYDDAREVIDVLLDGQAAIINLEGISFDLAAQITDFIFGGCYALEGNVEQVNNFIFVITPYGLEITGDIQSLNKKTNSSPFTFQAK